MFKYNRAPGASTDPENVKKKNPAISLQACEKISCSVSLPPWHKTGISFKLYHPLICKFPPTVPPVCFNYHCVPIPVLMSWWKFEKSMLTIRSLAALTSTGHCLESKRAVDLFTEYYNAATHIYYKHATIFSPFTDITDCFCNSRVFLTNTCVFDSFSIIRHER